MQQIKERYIQRNKETKAEKEYTKQQIRYYNDFRTRPPQQHGINDFSFDSCGLKLIVINDRDSNFLPIASFNSTPFKSEWAYNEKQNSIQTSLWLSINFFNAVIGRWEPFLEKFNFYANVNQDREFQKESIQLQVNSPLNVNLTEKLVENVYESHKSWAIVYEDYQTYEKILDKRQVESGGLGDLDFFNIFGGDPNKAEGTKPAPQLSLLDRRLAEAIVLQKQKSAERLQGVNTDEMITPYVIVNKTDLGLIVKRLFKKEQSEMQKYQDLLQVQLQHDLIDERSMMLKSQIYSDQLEAINAEQNARKKSLINMYKVSQGQIIDYMIDYND